MKRFAMFGCCAGLLALLCLDAAAQTRKRVPRFEDYPAQKIHEGKSAPLVLTTDTERDSVIYYQAIADGGTNFAGHYAVVTLTCGKSCIEADYLDLLSGKIIPGTIENSGWQQTHDRFREIEFRRGSRLIVYAGQINKKGPVGWHFYEFNDGKFKRIHTIVTKGDFSKPLAEWMK